MTLAEFHQMREEFGAGIVSIDTKNAVGETTTITIAACGAHAQALYDLQSQLTDEEFFELVEGVTGKKYDDD